MYLCFFPVAIGMVKGLTSPDPMQLDLMRTYNASVSQVLWKLRFPAAMPFLFASLKVAVAIALTGAIVGELPTGAQSGIGSRMLAGFLLRADHSNLVGTGCRICGGSTGLRGGGIERIVNRQMGARHEGCRIPRFLARRFWRRHAHAVAGHGALFQCASS
jgi:NitT/TauT family transport system permease protein